MRLQYEAVISKAKQLAKNRLVQCVLLFVVAWCVLLSFLFSELLKGENYLEIFPSWLGVSACIYAATAAVAALGVYACKVPKTMPGKLASVVLLALFCVNYDTRLQGMAQEIKAFIPILPTPESGGDMAVTSLVLLVIFFILGLGAGWLLETVLAKQPQIKGSNVALGIIALAGFIFLGQAVRALPTVHTIQKEYAVQPPALPAATSASQEKPDIYYIVLDRYASNQVLRDQLSFDNSRFTNTLREQGFAVNENAYANYPFTSLSIASTLSADYTNKVSEPFKEQDVQSRTLYHKLVQQSEVINSLKRAGYVYHSVGSIYGTSAKTPLADVEHMYTTQVTFAGLTKKLRGTEESTFKESIFYRFAKLTGVSWWPLKAKQVDQLEYSQAQLATLDSLAEEQTGGRFIFAHILIPHPPYFFNADGSLATNPQENDTGKRADDKYLGQVKFINQQMESLVSTVKQRSNGKAVIVLNADEGPYPTSLNLDGQAVSADASKDVRIARDDMRDWSDTWLRTKYGILQAAYIPGASDTDMKQLSSVNVFRIILNSHLGYALPYLPQCHLAMSHGSIDQYKQVDITARLTGRSSEYCRSLTNEAL